MNNSKTEIIAYGRNRVRSVKLNISSVNVGGYAVKTVSHVRDLGVYMANTCTLNFDDHIKKCQLAHIQFRNLKRIRNHFTRKNRNSSTRPNTFTH